MTHEELLKTLSGEEPIYVRDILYSALRTVVELHKPVTTALVSKECLCCECAYPCPTISAVEKALE